MTKSRIAKWTFLSFFAAAWTIGVATVAFACAGHPAGGLAEYFRTNPGLLFVVLVLFGTAASALNDICARLKIQRVIGVPVEFEENRVFPNDMTDTPIVGQSKIIHSILIQIVLFAGIFLVVKFSK